MALVLFGQRMRHVFDPADVVEVDNDKDIASDDQEDVSTLVTLQCSKSDELDQKANAVAYAADESQDEVSAQFMLDPGVLVLHHPDYVGLHAHLVLSKSHLEGCFFVRTRPHSIQHLMTGRHTLLDLEA